MSGELTVAIKGGLRKSAKEVLEHSDDVKKTAKNAEEAKQIDEVIKHLEDVAEAGIKNTSKRAKRVARTAKEGDIHKSFFENAGISLKKEEGLGLISGQTKPNTCAANSLRMVLDDLGITKYEDTLAAALKTDKNGANILDIPEALNNAYIEGLQTISRGGRKDRNITFNTLEKAMKTGNKKAVVSIHTDDFGAHAVVVNKIENGRVFVRDPLPLNIGSSYSVTIEDFKSVFYEKFVTINR
ncbi:MULTISPECIES: cysteine peptidase family C39 domain-containing protein [Flavobacterium]|uniref:Cysteine peptidase family C39 domain-containing protein n=1 Tax=Flavobacterium jumunjinense TaxID=998845 RepID=A0ABV5GNK1_9FLAO|nr:MULTISPECIES: cysteine peptidase family C39 domain-containing protein [Flavobacterium]